MIYQRNDLFKTGDWKSSSPSLFKCYHKPHLLKLRRVGGCVVLNILQAIESKLRQFCG